MSECLVAVSASSTIIRVDGEPSGAARSTIARYSVNVIAPLLN